MSRHWSEPLDDFTQDYNVLDVPQQFLAALHQDFHDVPNTIEKIMSGTSEQLKAAALFLNNLDKLLTQIGECHVTVCIHQHDDGPAEKCSDVVEVCTVLLKELDRRAFGPQNGVSLVLRAWLDIMDGSEFQIFVLDSSIKGTCTSSLVSCNNRLLFYSISLTAIFQRKTERDRMSMDQRKLHLFMLKDFLRSIVLQIEATGLCKTDCVDTFLQQNCALLLFFLIYRYDECIYR